MRRTIAFLITLPVAWTSAVAAAAADGGEHAAYRRPGGAAALTEPAIGAGFRALFTCSAHFWAGRPLADIVAVELADSTPLGLPEPAIDETRLLVRQADGAGGVRVAAFRPSMGCTILPVGWREADVVRLPNVELAPPPDVSDQPFPIGDRVAIAPDPELEVLLDRAFDRTYGEGTLTAGVVIVHDGAIVAERYRPGFGIHQGYRTWSTAKSITAALVGIATGDGLLGVAAPAPIPEWRSTGDPRGAIELRHLMWMSSGLWSQGADTNAVYFGGQDAISAITGTPLEAEPGTRWKYANNDTLLLLRSLRAVLDDDLAYLRFPYDRLFNRIGMYHTRMEVDHAGNFIGSSQVYTTARDLARFALLHLDNGVWQGERILPEKWTEFVATPAPSRPPVANQEGYGAQFWLYGTFDGIPKGTYTTSGNKGQHATIVPERDLVIVRTGVDPAGKRWNQPAFVRDVVASHGADRST